MKFAASGQGERAQLQLKRRRESACRHFSQSKFVRMSYKYPRSRQSDIINWIIRQWEAKSPQEIQLEYRKFKKIEDQKFFPQQSDPEDGTEEIMKKKEISQNLGE